MTRIRQSKTARLFSSFMLLMVLWSQTFASVPQVVEHEVSVSGEIHAETHQHLMALPDSNHVHEDGTKHDVHLHFVSAQVVAIPVSMDFAALPEHSALAFFIPQHSSVRQPETLLRPPAA